MRGNIRRWDSGWCKLGTVRVSGHQGVGFGACGGQGGAGGELCAVPRDLLMWHAKPHCSHPRSNLLLGGRAMSWGEREPRMLRALCGAILTAGLVREHLDGLGQLPGSLSFGFSHL